MQQVQVQEQQQGHSEESLHTAAHEQFRLRVPHMRQTVQDQKDSESPREAEPQRSCPADRVRRVRPLVQEPSRSQSAHKVQARQAGVYLSDMSTGHDHAGESRPASHVARDQGEGAVFVLRQEIPPP